MNKVILIGNLTRDPESAQTQNGTAVIKMTIAVNRKFSNANGERETDYFNIVAWRGLAENCAKYLSKGKKIAVTGSLQKRIYEDKYGDKRQIVEIVAEEIDFLSPIGEEQQQRKEQPSRRSINDLTPVDEDDLPF